MRSGEKQIKIEGVGGRVKTAEEMDFRFRFVL